MREIARVARSAGLVAAAALAFGVGGCRALGRQAFKQPTVELRDVRVRSLGFSGGTVDVVLGVHNPNNYRLDATKVSYHVFVGDSVTLADGTVEKRFTVDGADSSTVSLPVTFTYAGIGAAGRQLMQMGAADYKVIGDVTVGTAVGHFTVPFTATGRFTPTGVTR
jgi:LEA14-like dessication related protein